MTTKVKRYVLMGSTVYYASGGFEGYIGSYNDRPEAEAALKAYLAEKGDYYWAHVGDLETGEYFGTDFACIPMGVFR